MKQQTHEKRAVVIDGGSACSRKKPDAAFTKDEIDLLHGRNGLGAIGLSSAKSYDVLKKNRTSVAQQAKMAALGTFSAGIRHEIKNKLQVIRGIAEMLRFNKKSGIYKDYTKEQYEELIADALARILDAVDRATGAIGGLSYFDEKHVKHKIEL